MQNKLSRALKYLSKQMLFASILSALSEKRLSSRLEIRVLALCVNHSLFMLGNDTNRPFYSCVLSYLAMNASEAGVGLALIQTSLLFSCKCKLVSIRTT